MSADALLQSFSMHGLELPNRVVLAPMTRARAGTQRVPSPEVVKVIRCQHEEDQEQGCSDAGFKADDDRQASSEQEDNGTGQHHLRHGNTLALHQLSDIGELGDLVSSGTHQKD